MALTKTLLQLRKSLARKVGIDGADGDTASADLTAVVLNEFLTDARYESYDIITGKWLDYYTTSSSQAVVAGTDSYAVPTDFYKLRAIWISTGTTTYRRLYSANLDAAAEFTGSSGGDRNYRYRMQGRNIILMPIPGAAETLKIYYIPLPSELVSDSDSITFDVPIEIKLMLAIAWRDCLDRQNLDPSPAIAKIEAYTGQLRTAADSRDAGEPFYLNPRGAPGGNDDDYDGGL